eukprot:6166032-Prymnesium_polylepis.1
MMRKKKNMWFGTSALSIVTFVSLYDSINWRPLTDAMEADKRNQQFKTIVAQGGLASTVALPTPEETLQVIVHSPDPQPAESPTRTTRAEASQRDAAAKAASQEAAPASEDVVVGMSEFAGHQLMNNSQTNTQS